MRTRNSHVQLALVAAPSRDYLSDTDLARALIAGAAWAYIVETAQAMSLSVSTVKRLQERATEQLSAWSGTDFELTGLLLRKRGCHAT
jgi:hypothetical protein